jgi:hypothetical protein
MSASAPVIADHRMKVTVPTQLADWAQQMAFRTRPR